MPRRRVCAYDGHCYRKNPQHFSDYAHPVQYPGPTDAPMPSPAAAGDPPTIDVDRTHEADSKRARVEDPRAVVDVDAQPRDAEAESQSELELQDTVCAEDLSATAAAGAAGAEGAEEGAPASPQQLVWFLRHAPSLGAVMPTRSGDGERRTEADASSGPTHPPRLDGTSWAGVAEVLRLAYPSLGFHASDVRCVLTAACALRPDCPLLAFPGWQLVGPFELAWRYAQLRSCELGDGGDDAGKSALSAPAEERTSVRGAMEALLCGRTAEEEVRRWRCARFRYDPPECQTVAVLVPSPADATTQGGTAAAAAEVTAGLHLCYHRDHPTDLPGMLVRGTAQEATFAVANHRGWLAPYLYAWSQRHGRAPPAVGTTHTPVMAAISAALDDLAGSDELRAACEHSLAQQASAAARRKRWVAATRSGLGLWVPVQADTDVGYREPNIPARVSLAECLRDCEAAFVASARAAVVVGYGPGSHSSSDGRDGEGPPRPPSRSAQHEQLAKAKPLTNRTSEALDDIFLCADIANDEGDCGTSLELGLNCMACILADVCAATRGSSASPVVDPVLWHTYRLLDCAYMLLNRPLYRHILRCHIPQLADAYRPVPLTLSYGDDGTGGLQRCWPGTT